MTDNTPPRRAGDRICFLHIGPHKTGTTSIQNALFSNAEKLAEIGVFYPVLTDKSPGRVRRNHTPLARMRVMRSPDFNKAPYWADLGKQIASVPGSIVISSEHFADVLRDEPKYRKTVDFFHGHGFRIVVVAYLRDQPAWLNSWYTQDQRNFMSQRSFGEFLDDALETGLVDPWAILRRFIDDERIEVRVVSFDKAVKQGLAKSFLRAVGAPEDFTLPEPKASNPNIGVKGIYSAQEIMRRIGFRVRSMASYPKLYERFKALIKQRDWESEAYIGATPEQEARIRDRYAASNEEFAQQWFGESWASACPPRALTQREFDFDAAAEVEQAEVLEVVDEMVGLIRAAEAEEGAPQVSATKGRKAKAAKAALAEADAESESGADPAEDDAADAERAARRGRRKRRKAAAEQDAAARDAKDRKREKKKAEKTAEKTGDAPSDAEKAARKERRKKKAEDASGAP